MEQKKESNYVFDECKDWFCKYQEAYQKLGDICSSKEGKQLSLCLDSTIKCPSDSDYPMRYIFSLDLHSPRDDIFIEGPSISVASENKASIQYLTAVMTEHYLSVHPNMSIRLKDFRGYLVNSNDSTYGVTKTRFIASDIMKKPDLSSVVLGMISNYLLKFPNEPEIHRYYAHAEVEKGRQDCTFIRSVDTSDLSFQKVLQLSFFPQK